MLTRNSFGKQDIILSIDRHIAEANSPFIIISTSYFVNRGIKTKSLRWFWENNSKRKIMVHRPFVNSLFIMMKNVDWF